MHWSGGSAESTRQTSGFSFPDASMKLTEKYHQRKHRHEVNHDNTAEKSTESNNWLLIP